MRESVLSDRRTTGTAGDVLRQVAVISALCFMLIASVVNILIWASVGLVWWKILGWW